MPLNFAGDTVIVDGPSSVEDAMTLLDFLRSNADGQIDLGPCTHLHTAVLQVLLAARAKIVAPPQEPFLARWLPPALGLERTDPK